MIKRLVCTLMVVFLLAMAAGKAAGIANSAGPVREFRRALDLATTDVEKAEALLAIGRACLANVNETNTTAVRSEYAKALALKTLTPQQRAEACLGIAETRLADKNYPATREACAQARVASDDANWIAQAQMVLARSYLQERNYPVARQEFARLLELPGVERKLPGAATDRQLKWEGEALLGGIDLLPRMRADHPRLFFNAETWPAVKARALTVEKALFDQMKAKVDTISPEDIRSGDWAIPDTGVREAAFVYRVTGDPAVLEKVRRMLWVTANDVFPKGREGGENSSPSIAWVAALDWVWNDLVPPEREALADAMIRYACNWVSKSKAQKKLAGWPHYYIGTMCGFVGIALLEPLADDVACARALSLLGIGFKHYQERFASLISVSGDDGVWQTNIEYDFTTVPAPVIAFLYAWQPATGSEMPQEWVNVAVSPDFMLRMIVGMGPDHIKHFNYAGHSGGVWGFGQANSVGLYSFLGGYVNFFGQSHPREAAIAQYLRRRMVETGAGSSDTPILRFLITDYAKALPPELPPGLPVARFFESVGLVLMSSGFGSNDTYALFSQGGGVHSRRHDYDATHFSIYKRGHLALDTGVRNACEHCINYRHQTVAHNGILIHMPGERFPGTCCGGPVIANTGGQNLPPEDARALAFETDRLYAYTAIDATPVYNTNKCLQMVRQFIYLPPDHFVVFDRVTSKNADYPKTWLLHTANEPVMLDRDPAAAGQGFRADQGQGRLLCRTLLPTDAVLEKVGGPGKEFWADGRNWAIVNCGQEPGAGTWWKRYGRNNTEPTEAMGRWRVEVKPGTVRTDDVFLHLIQVSDQIVEKMVESKVSEKDNQVTLAFNVGPRAYAISLNKTGEVGGHIRIEESRKAVVDKDLTENIQPQAGLALEQPVSGKP